MWFNSEIMKKLHVLVDYQTVPVAPKIISFNDIDLSGFRETYTIKQYFSVHFVKYCSFCKINI